jgi:uncharacterized protein YbaA (DUF1428 family)
MSYVDGFMLPLPKKNLARYRSIASKHCDQVMKKVMADPYVKNFDMPQSPLDGERMFWGGFKSIVSL